MSKAVSQDYSSKTAFQGIKPDVQVETVSRNYQAIFRFLPEIENGQEVPHRDVDGDLTAWFTVQKMVTWWGTNRDNFINSFVQPADAEEKGITSPNLYPYNVAWNFLYKNTNDKSPNFRKDLEPWIKRDPNGRQIITKPRDVFFAWAQMYQNRNNHYPEGKTCLMMVTARSAFRRILDKVNFREGGQYACAGNLTNLNDAPLCALTKLGAYPLRPDGNAYSYYDIRCPIPEGEDSGYAYDFFILQDTVPATPSHLRPLNYGQEGAFNLQSLDEQMALMSAIFPMPVFKEIFQDYPFLPDRFYQSFRVPAVPAPAPAAPLSPQEQAKYANQQKFAGNPGAMNFTAPQERGTVAQGDPLMAGFGPGDPNQPVVHVGQTAPAPQAPQMPQAQPPRAEPTNPNPMAAPAWGQPVAPAPQAPMNPMAPQPQAPVAPQASPQAAPPNPNGITNVDFANDGPTADHFQQTFADINEELKQ